jgi:hypothetical protein
MFRPTWPSSGVYDNKEKQPGKHAHKNQKINGKNTTEKHKWKHAKYNHVQEKATKTTKQIPSGIYNLNIIHT